MTGKRSSRAKDGPAPGDRLRPQIWRAYRQHLQGKPTEGALLATICYFVTLLFVRIFTTLTHPAAGTGDIVIGATHIHHVVFGVAAILISGVMSLDGVLRLPRAALFGIGAALVLDEFALIVFLKDVYWLPQGVLSWVAILVGLVTLVVNTWRSGPFLRDVAKIISQRPNKQPGLRPNP